MDRFGLRENEWIQHVAISGRSGAGKTNVGLLILEQLFKHGKPVWIFDWKRNHRDAAVPLGIPVLTVGRDVNPFGFNPRLPAPGCDQMVWFKKLVAVLAHVYGFRHATVYTLQRTLHDMSREKSPTFREVLRAVEQIRGAGREVQ